MRPEATITMPVFRASPPRHQYALPYLTRVMESRQLSNGGPLVKDTETKIAALLRTDPELVVSFSSCTLAIAASLASFESESVTIPDYTFIGTLRAAQIAQKRVEVWDVDPESGELASGPVKNGIRLFVAPFGAWKADYLRFDGPTVFDCAASFGAMPDLSDLSEEHVICFSFHATKVLGAGEGGVAVFGSSERALRARRWLNFGIDQSIPERPEALGVNGKMSEVQAAFLLAKVDGWQEEQSEWEIARQAALKVSHELGLDATLTPHGHATPYWVVRLESSSVAERLVLSLRNDGIQTRNWWPASMGEVLGSFPLSGSSILRGTVLGLPFFLGMSQQETGKLRASLARALSKEGLPNQKD